MANIIRIGGGGGSQATLITKSITQNGVYNASSDNADGYSSVDVAVSGGGATRTLLYSLDQSQGGRWINTGVNINDYSKLLFFNSVSGVEEYGSQYPVSKIAVLTPTSGDVYTVIFSAGYIGLDFNARFYNDELYISYNGAGSSSKVVSVYALQGSW